MAMPLDIPPIFETPAMYLVGVIVLLMLVGSVALAVTFCRRCVRHCRISWRREGCGSAEHPNQDLDDGKPELPSLGAAKEALALVRQTTTADDDGPQLPPGDGPTQTAA